MKKIGFLLLGALLPLLGESYIPKDYGYLIPKMPKINASLLETHFALYRGYVKEVNHLDELLKTASNKDNYLYQSIKRRFGWEYDGMRLHELYFENLGGNGQFTNQLPLIKAIHQEFGSIQNWIDDFQKVALTRGIGWVILFYHKETNKLRNVWVGEHDTGLLVLESPILVVDLWEHAYLCQFTLNRQQYVETIFEYLDWDVLNHRFTASCF